MTKLQRCQQEESISVERSGTNSSPRLEIVKTHLNVANCKFEEKTMLGALLTLLATALSLLVVDLVVPGVNLATFPAALIGALAIGGVNSSVKPILSTLSMPLNFLSLGLFSLVVNGLCFWLASVFVPGFSVSGPIAFLLGPIILSFVNTFLSKYFAEKYPDLKLEGAQTNADRPIEAAQRNAELKLEAERTPDLTTEA